MIAKKVRYRMCDLMPVTFLQERARSKSNDDSTNTETTMTTVEMVRKMAECVQYFKTRDARFALNKPLQAGPAPSAPDLGVLYDGNGPRRVPGTSAEELRRNLRLANADLTDEDIEYLVGVTMEPIGKLGGARPASDVQGYRRQRAADAAEIQRVQDINDAFWDPDGFVRRKAINRELARR